MALTWQEKKDLGISKVWKDVNPKNHERFSYKLKRTRDTNKHGINYEIGRDFINSPDGKVYYQFVDFVFLYNKQIVVVEIDFDKDEKPPIDYFTAEILIRDNEKNLETFYDKYTAS